jgi:two-component system, response regulator YesN
VSTFNSQEGFRRRNRTNTVTPEGGGSDSVAAHQRLPGPAVEGRVQKILQKVESGTTLNIRELALEFRLSPAYLQRLFKHQTGVSMGEWMNEQRLQRAANLLADSYMSVKEIAYTIGYGHASSFIRAFERRFAQAPLRYRKQCNYAKC